VWLNRLAIESTAQAIAGIVLATAAGISESARFITASISAVGSWSMFCDEGFWSSVVRF
jgi:hypothetical protein